MIAAALPMAGFATSTMVRAIQGLYGIAIDVNTWTDNHLRELQNSDNLTVARTGKVLEGAKLGFGLGYVVPVTAIAVGQFLLGNTLQAAITVGTAATLTNPFAMTCAAVGAICYGWGALSSDEQKNVLETIGAGLKIGVELIKSVVNFIISTTKELMNSKNLAEIKDFVREAAATFGKTLSDVTHAISDRITDTAQAAKALAISAVDATVDGVKNGSQAAGTAADKIKGRIKKTLGRGDDVS